MAGKQLLAEGLDYGSVLEALGFTPDPWQLEIVRKAEEHSILGISVPRQNGKTELAIMLLVLTALRGEAGAFFGHQGDVVREGYRRACVICQPLVEQGLVKPIKKRAGLQMIETAAGGRLYFRIRTRGAAVGLTLDRIVFDEAQKMSSQSYEDILPVTTTSKHRSIILMGTPPTDEDLEMGETPFIRLRKHHARGGWVEWGIGDYSLQHEPFTLRTAKAVNPAWKRIPDFTKMLREQQATLSDEAFARQRLGAWVLPDSTVYHRPELSTTEVKRCLSTVGPSTGLRLRAAVGLYPDADSAWVCFTDGVHAELVYEAPLEGGSLGQLLAWLLPRMRRISKLIVPANARGKALVDLLREKRADYGVELSTMPKTATSLQLFLSQLRDGTLKIFENTAAAMALSSFWLGYSEKASCATLECQDAGLRAAVLALALAAVDEPITARLSTQKGFFG